MHTSKNISIKYELLNIISKVIPTPIDLATMVGNKVQNTASAITKACTPNLFLQYQENASWLIRLLINQEHWSEECLSKIEFQSYCLSSHDIENVIIAEAKLNSHQIYLSSFCSDIGDVIMFGNKEYLKNTITEFVKNAYSYSSSNSMINTRLTSNANSLIITIKNKSTLASIIELQKTFMDSKGVSEFYPQTIIKTGFNTALLGLILNRGFVRIFDTECEGNYYVTVELTFLLTKKESGSCN